MPSRHIGGRFVWKRDIVMKEPETRIVARELDP